MLDQQSIYKFRKKLRELYKKEPELKNDLLFPILDIENSQEIASIHPNIEEFNIVVELTEATKSTDTLSYIMSCIFKFITSNMNYLNLDSDEVKDFGEFMTKGLFADYTVLGKVITISL